METNVNIAVIAWGSLIWNLGMLDLRTPWHCDGPALPLEFARISRGGRLTLVLFPPGLTRPTYWAISSFKSLDVARANLADREGSAVDAIHFCFRDPATQQRRQYGDLRVTSAVDDWLLARQRLDMAIWTGLDSNWQSERGVDYSVDDAVRYLSGLHGPELEAAREYVTHAPPQIDTPVRQAMRARGWQDVALPVELFAKNQAKGMS